MRQFATVGQKAANYAATTRIFMFNQPATNELSTLSLHDALPIYRPRRGHNTARAILERWRQQCLEWCYDRVADGRSEEHTSELQSPDDLVCRLLLEKKKASYRRSTHARGSCRVVARSNLSTSQRA